ncbi:uncharacterized protein LOC141915037 isoform X1 [Tubulanus polymorphus]|uniref:uncharacterized protein LOC141915037 isoform X1 n=1 Tax=Tubulanus polymorphus TaxID=672921 RepID=UPI003DA50948
MTNNMSLITFQKIFPISIVSKDDMFNKATSRDCGCVGIFLGSGEHSWLATSLMFQSAVSISATGNSIVVILSQPLTKLPASVHGMIVANPNTLLHVKFKYVKTCSELTDYLASIHCSAVAPYQIIIDSLQDFIPNNLNSGHIDDFFVLANLCAAIKDAAVYMKTKRSVDDCFPILASSILIPGNLEYNFYHRFFKHLWLISDFMEEDTNGVRITEILPKSFTNEDFMYLKLLPSDPIDLLEFCYPT